MSVKNGCGGSLPAREIAYRVRQELRDVVLFAHHDLLKDPPFSRVELISCRNVLIYLDRELQEQVVSTFNYALNPGGFLLLGYLRSCRQSSRSVPHSRPQPRASIRPRRIQTGNLACCLVCSGPFASAST